MLEFRYQSLVEEDNTRNNILEILDAIDEDELSRVKLERRKHISFLLKGLNGLSNSFTPLDASKPWIIYWIVRSLNLLGHELDNDSVQRVITTLNMCQHEDGGYGGGPGQLPHLACTFAAVNTLALLECKSAYASLEREKLILFLHKMKQKDGSFSVHESGECDVRGAYCAVAVASLTGILKQHQHLFENTKEFLLKCQTYEGGFAAFPNTEAHAGYTYCAFAALSILGAANDAHLHGLDRFAQLLQCPQTGGFKGRLNKLVDGCYSFWAGSLFSLLRRVCPGSYFDSIALQKYILLACQSDAAGFRDKPSKAVDYYHTCYCLSGLSIAQRETPDFSNQDEEEDFNSPNFGLCVGDASNRLPTILPEYNLSQSQLSSIMNYFSTNRFHE